MKTYRHFVIHGGLLPSLLLAAATACAQVGDSEPLPDKPVRAEQTMDIGLEYAGVVTNQTRTSLGYQFHSAFVETWNTQSESESFGLSVREISSPRYGTEVQVLYENMPVFRTVLPRSLIATRAVAASAAVAVSSKLVEINVQKALFSDPDMAGSAF